MKTFYVWQRELVSLFTSPVGYVAIALMTAVNSFFFWLILKAYPYATLQPLLQNMCITLLFFLPAFTMRQLAEEKKSGTAELLFTAPLTDNQIVLGKYLAALTMYVVALVVALMYPIIMKVYGDPDMGPVYAGFLGILLLGAAYLVVGLFVSSLTSNQIVAYIGTLGILLVFFFLPVVAQRAEGNWLRSFFEFFGLDVQINLRDVLTDVGMSSHFEDFPKGAIDLKHVAYYVMFVAFFLFMTVRSVETRKWR